MKKCLILLVFAVGFSATQLAAQVDSARLEKTQRQIDDDKKDAAKLERKIDKKQNKIDRQQRKMERKEKKLNRKMKSIDREERKKDMLQSDSTRTSFSNKRLRAKPVVSK